MMQYDARVGAMVHDDPDSGMSYPIQYDQHAAGWDEIFTMNADGSWQTHPTSDSVQTSYKLSGDILAYYTECPQAPWVVGRPTSDEMRVRYSNVKPDFWVTLQCFERMVLVHDPHRELPGAPPDGRWTAHGVYPAVLAHVRALTNGNCPDPFRSNLNPGQAKAFLSGVDQAAALLSNNLPALHAVLGI